MNEDQKTGFDAFLPFKWGFVVIIIIGFLYYLISKITPSFSIFKKKYSKKEMASYYNVSKKTFNKWSVFWQNHYGIADDYPKRKLLNSIEASFIMYKLGDPEEFPVMTKKQIIEAAEGTYKSLRESVKTYPDKFGISYEYFRGMKKFPPNIAKQIKEQYC